VPEDTNTAEWCNLFAMPETQTYWCPTPLLGHDVWHRLLEQTELVGSSGDRTETILRTLHPVDDWLT
jgi:hypothetical protein